MSIIRKMIFGTLLVIDNETIIFYENGCFEAKKIK